jgi:serine/threonine protein kinase
MLVGEAREVPSAHPNRLGSYEIVRRIARGGMAEILLARTRGPEGMDQLVVLKTILPKHAENPRFVRLFLDEAKLVASLDHPHIAKVFDTGQVDGRYFFTMEHIHGDDVRSTLRRTSRLQKRFPIDLAVQIARHIAGALHYAHERRSPDGALLDVVHRDVSPSNILISYDGAVKLVDFGVAKAATSTVKTRTGTLKGKIAYMSPEQAKGAPIDHRSDIFSLGIVIWEMLTTARLFKGANDLATIQMIINSKAQPPSRINPAVSPELDRIVARALEMDVNARYQSAAELALDLEEYARQQTIASPTVTLRAYMQQIFEPEIAAWNDALAQGQTLIEHLATSHGLEQTQALTGSELDFISEDDFDGDDDEDEEELADSEQATAMHAVFVEPHMPFPVVPPEWRASQPQLVAPVANAQRTKQILIAGSVAFALIVLVLAIFVRTPSPKPDEPSVVRMPTAVTPIDATTP